MSSIWYLLFVFVLGAFFGRYFEEIVRLFIAIVKKEKRQHE
jgi:hypothetical protein